MSGNAGSNDDRLWEDALRGDRDPLLERAREIVCRRRWEKHEIDHQGDVVSMVQERIIRYLDRGLNPVRTSFAAFVTQWARHSRQMLTGERRSRKEIGAGDAHEVADTSNDPRLRAEKRECEEAVRGCLDAIRSPLDRQLCLLWSHGHDWSRIRETIGTKMTLGAMRIRKCRAMRELASCLRGKGIVNA